MKIVQFSFGKYEFFPELIISTINKGVHFDKEKYHEVMQLVKDYYEEGAPIAYISLRKNEYTVDPTIHKEKSHCINLCAIAIVERKPIYKSTVRLESRFFTPGKLKSFNNIKDALTWTNQEVENKIKELSQIAS